MYSSVHHFGCGQGKDTLFIARKGHTVLGVDAVQTAIKKMLKLAVLENLIVNGISVSYTHLTLPTILRV